MVGTNLQTMLNGTNFAVVISAEIAGCASVDNDASTEKLTDLLDASGMRYVSATGCYKGTQEQSFIVMCSDIYDVMRIECIGISLFSQESVLIIDMIKECVLLKYASTVSMIGANFVPVNMLSGEDAYTIVDGQIWVVV